jgi:hypothetical protein
VITDINGKVLLNRTYQAAKGVNTIEVSKADLPNATGVVIYKIESDTQAIQRKMIIVE